MIVKHELETPERRQNNERRGCSESASMCPCSQVRLLLKKWRKSRLRYTEAPSLYLLCTFCSTDVHDFWLNSGQHLEVIRGHRGPPSRPSNMTAAGSPPHQPPPCSRTSDLSQGHRIISQKSARIINVNVEGYEWRLDGCRDDGVLPGDATDLKTAAEKVGGASVFDLLF